MVNKMGIITTNNANNRSGINCYYVIENSLPSSAFEVVTNFSSSLEMANTMKNKQPYIPESIYFNQEKGVTVVKWLDGSETKLTCSLEDKFSPEIAYYIALAIKMFGNNKSEFKNKFLPIILRRIRESSSKKIKKAATKPLALSA
jgi:hypothetical protein